MRKEIELSCGIKVRVGGRPLMSEDQLAERWPLLDKAHAKHKKILGDYEKFLDMDDAKLDENTDAFMDATQRLHGSMGDLCFQICSVTNCDLVKDTFFVDADDYREIMGTWNGIIDSKKK
jgi:hypothetical protein